MTDRRVTVQRLGEKDAPQIVDVLFESFFDYPAMRFIFGTEEGDYEHKLRALLDFFVKARVLRGETLLGIGSRENLEGTALVSRPAGPMKIAELDALREQTWVEVGAPARARYDAFSAACSRFDLPVPHIHLNMVGVRRLAQGKGLGRRLIEYVHELSREDPASEGVSLNTEDPRNIPLYERLGYEIVGHAQVASELETWIFFRRD